MENYSLDRWTVTMVTPSQPTTPPYLCFRTHPTSLHHLHTHRKEHMHLLLILVGNTHGHKKRHLAAGLEGSDFSLRISPQIWTAAWENLNQESLHTDMQNSGEIGGKQTSKAGWDCPNTGPASETCNCIISEYFRESDFKQKSELVQCCSSKLNYNKALG